MDEPCGKPIEPADHEPVCMLANGQIRYSPANRVSAQSANELARRPHFNCTAHAPNLHFMTTKKFAQDSSLLSYCICRHGANFAGCNRSECGACCESGTADGLGGGRCCRQHALDQQ